MKTKADCVILGGGVVGTAIAYYLAKMGVRDIVVLEAAYLASGATGRCGGGIRQQGGYLVLAYTDEDVGQFGKNVELQRGLGLNVESLTPREITESVVPELNTAGVRMATWCPDDASANPFLTTQAYAEAAKRLGVEIEIFTPARGILVERGRIVGVATDRGTISSPIVVNAAGSHSAPLARTAGVELPISPYRREILVTEPLERFFHPMIISFSLGIYFRQTKHGAVIGGFGDPDEPVGFNETSSLEFLVAMSRKLAHLMPVLSSVKVVRQWAGLYDVTPDAQPILGPVDEVDGFFQASGFSGHGFMIAPKVAELVAQAAAGREPDIDIDRLNARRFRGEITADRSVV